MSYKFFSTAAERMSWFNRARRAGNLGDLEAARVCRALGVLQSSDGQERLAKYGATVGRCSCPDRLRHPDQQCKHMIARMIEHRIAEQREGDSEQFCLAVRMLAERPQWFNGEALWITHAAFVKCEGSFINLCWRGSHDYITIAWLNPLAGGWVAALDDETIGRIAAVWQGLPDPWHNTYPSHAFPGLRVR